MVLCTTHDGARIAVGSAEVSGALAFDEPTPGCVKHSEIMTEFVCPGEYSGVADNREAVVE